MPRYNGGELIDTPACILAAARALPGWALGSHKAESFPDGTLRITVHLSHRGGFAVPYAPFRARANGYRILHIHSAVLGSKATVWLTLRPG